MKRFIGKIIFFLIPIIAIQLYTLFFYDTAKGDLMRVGYIPNIHPEYREQFPEFSRDVDYIRISEPHESGNYDILIIGDSYSELGSYGYQNIVAEKSGYSILHFDDFLHQDRNPIQSLYGLLNADFFEHYQVKYVLLQVVERNIVRLALKTDTSYSSTLNKLDKMVQNYEPVTTPEYTFPSDRSLRFTYNSFKYLLDGDQTFNDKVRRAELTEPLFTTGQPQLLFSIRDLNALKWNNRKKNIQILNDMLNDLNTQLKKHGTALIVMPGADKYSTYYEYLRHQTRYEEPRFFTLIKNQSQDYIFINSYRILSDHLPEEKDLYFYDDTHWSPKGNQIIGQAVINELSGRKDK